MQPSPNATDLGATCSWRVTDGPKSAPTRPFTYWLGVHQLNWQWSDEISGPVMLTAHRLAARRSPWPRAKHPVFVDSGAFTALTNHGRWTMEPSEYVDLVLRLQRELGIQHAAIQDWMVAPLALAKTGLSVVEHQRRTIASLEQLRATAPGVPWVPVLHGLEPRDYLEHVAMYRVAGFDLQRESLVGLGSVAYRQADPVLADITLRIVDEHGLPLHGFGLKAKGLAQVGSLIVSADSMAWSEDGRRRTQKAGDLRDSVGRRLANSPEHAESFRTRMVDLARAAKRPVHAQTQAAFEWNAA